MTYYTDGIVLDGGDFSDYDQGAVIDGGSFDAPDISALEKMRNFVASYPYMNLLDELNIDYTDNVPNSGGLFPDGLVEIQRNHDIVGNVTVLNQYNFALYTTLEKSPDEDYGATINAEWLMDFQEWVQRQSANHQTPTFGDEPRSERITAQNGALYSAEGEGTAIYMIQISVTFTKKY